MLLLGNKVFLLLSCCAISIVAYNGESNKLLDVPTRSSLVDKILEMLDQIEWNENISANMKFSTLLSEFLIRQKVRFYEPTRYEEQLYFGIFQKLNSIIKKNFSTDELHKRIFENIFQRDVLLIAPTLKGHHIDTHFEFKSLVNNYDQLVESGFPNATLSDLCLDAIVTLDTGTCNLRADCMSIITSDLPTFGYQRMHQILLLYVFIHHDCSTKFGSQMAYEILASQKCTQVYREQNVIRSLDIPLKYRDLFLEQNVVCGLFGYIEFLNWKNIEVIMSWNNDINCSCSPQIQTDTKPECDCRNHINSLALAYYINAFLMLN